MWITIIINNAHTPNWIPPLLIAIRIIGTDDIHMPNTGIKPHINTMVESRAMAFTFKKYRQMAVNTVLIADMINTNGDVYALYDFEGDFRIKKLK